ncbi:hypothetical protein [Rhizobium sp. RAF56]|uniref:hypothetical protein n=1 Tax=Rhizobium sp. RAF56 TaxID=3233062 RepID=UPI003F999481
MPKKRPITIEPAAARPGKGTFNGSSCGVCSLPITVLKCVDEMLARGEQVSAVTEWAHKNFPAETSHVAYMTFRNHRLNHVDQKVRAFRKLSDAEKQRKAENRLVKKILNDEVDPQTYFGPAALAHDIQRTTDRLEVAADCALDEGLFPALAALSNTLVRTHELRGKLGGSINEGPQLNVAISIGQLHERLDTILAGDHAERQSAARQLLGISIQSNPAMPVMEDPDDDRVIDGELEQSDEEILRHQTIDPQPR